MSAVAAEGWHGFPVYPPEGAATLGPEGGILEPRNLADLRRACDQPDRRSRCGGHPGDGEGNFPEMEYNTVRAEFATALEHFAMNAPRQGWTLLDEGAFLDGGSRFRSYGKLDECIRVVTVTVSSGGFTGDLAPGSAWGTIHYRYEEQELPFMVHGFPTCTKARSMEAFHVEHTEDGLRLIIDTKDCFEGEDSLVLARLPLLTGWQAHRSPLLRGSPSLRKRLWKKGADVVAVERLPNGRRAYLFVSPARVEGVLAEHPARVEREVIVPKGCLILRGRYVRPPLRFRLDGERLTVNGELLRDKNPHLEDSFDEYSDPVGDLESFASPSEKGLLDIQASHGRTSVRLDRLSIRDCHGLMGAIDRVVRSKEARLAELYKLLEIKLPLRSVESLLNEILDRWDGID
ncbi:MAG TPA: hypothetical protein PLC99_14180 [Verrucomicrobiota bacterium]|nr:hypothetical protein [Verrucomicrobiota bacterium]